MMCCGVLPIDTMKDFISPVSLIIHRVPKEVLEDHYKINLPALDSKNYNASVFLQVLAAKRGLVTGRGLPNEAMSARYVLKDYVNGRLLFCHIRPDFDRQTHGEVMQSGFKTHTTVGIAIGDQEEEEKEAQEDGSEQGDDEDDNDSEEEREEVKELPTGDHSDVHSQATTMLTTSSKYRSESMVETNLDREFFVLQ